jgi:capsular polysaccharide biosynthesis protein
MEKAIWLGGNFSWNYYHLLYEFAVKFIYLNKLDISLDVPVLVDQVCLTNPRYNELLNIANKKGYKLIGVDRRYRSKVRELIHISCPNLIPAHVKRGAQANDMQFNVNILRDLQAYLLSYSSRKEFPKRIFISRKNASRRRKFNEEAVMQLVSEFGFEAVFPEKLSVADQISLFNQAEWIMGGSGAAFTNLLFCSNSTKVIIISRAYFPFSGFSTIAATLGIYLLYLTEEDTSRDMVRGDIQDPFEIDLPYLKEQLIALGL